MTEEEWLHPVDSSSLLDMIADGTSRKRRLLGAAVCYHLSTLIDLADGLEAIQAAEMYADGWERRSAMVYQGQRIGNTIDVIRRDGYSEAVHAIFAVCRPGIALDLKHLVHWASAATERVPDRVADAESNRLQFLRDIFGNPFRPVTFAPEWRTEAAIGIAAKMYDSRDFGNMPVLADALQDAGCEHADILAHCREPGTHVRGCWVVDLVLGKA